MSHERRTLKAMLPAFDEDIDDMSDAQVERELAAAGISLTASRKTFSGFAQKALAAARRRELDAAEVRIKSRPPPVDLFLKAKQLAADLTDDMIRALIIEKGGLVPSHRERDGSHERDLLLQTLADVMALKGEE